MCEITPGFGNRVGNPIRRFVALFVRRVCLEVKPIGKVFFRSSCRRRHGTNKESSTTNSETHQRRALHHDLEDLYGYVLSRRQVVDIRTREAFLLCFNLMGSRSDEGTIGASTVAIRDPLLFPVVVFSHSQWESFCHQKRRCHLTATNKVVGFRGSHLVGGFAIQNVEATRVL